MDGIGSFVTVRPMGPDDITNERMSQLMGADITLVTTSRIGDGLVGLNLRVGLECADPAVPSSVVIKLPSLDETSRATGMALRNYEREVKFYLGVADTVDIRVPHCHHGEWHESSGDFILVLEDMAPAEQGNQVTGCSPEMAVAAVEELAKLHAPRWDDPTLDDLDWLGGRSTPEDIAAVVGLWAMFMPSFLETYTHHLNAPQLDMLNAFGERIEGWMNGRSGSPIGRAAVCCRRFARIGFRRDSGGWIKKSDETAPDAASGSALEPWETLAPYAETRRHLHDPASRFRTDRHRAGV